MLGKSSISGFGILVQLVRTPACHAGGHGFESRRCRHYGTVAQVLESPWRVHGGRWVRGQPVPSIMNGVAQLVERPQTKVKAGGRWFESTNRTEVGD